MQVQVSLIGVILAAVAAMVIGFVWYHPKFFGATWQKMIGLSDKDMKKNMPTAMGMMVVVSLLTAYILDHFINYAHSFMAVSWMSAAVQTSLWVWLGFGLTTIVAHGAYEPRDRQVMLINAGNRLATLLAMGLVLGYFLGR
jgi:hypothetical protein